MPGTRWTRVVAFGLLAALVFLFLWTLHSWCLSAGILALGIAVGAAAWFLRGRKRLVAIASIAALWVAAVLAIGLAGRRTITVENRSHQVLAELTVFLDTNQVLQVHMIPGGRSVSTEVYSPDLRGVLALSGRLKDGTPIEDPEDCPVWFPSAPQTVRIVVEEGGEARVLAE